MAARAKLPADLNHRARPTHRNQRAVRGSIGGCLLRFLIGFAVLAGLSLFFSRDDNAPRPALKPETPATAPAQASRQTSPEPSIEQTPDPVAPAPIVPPAAPAQPRFAERETYKPSDIHPAILAAASRYGSHDDFPKTNPSRLDVGDVANLGGADVISLTEEGIQLSLSDGTTAFLRGISPSGLVSGSTISTGPVLVEDTLTYTTVLGGSRTGWRLRAISSSEWNQARYEIATRDAIAARNRLRSERLDLQAELDNPTAYEFRTADGQFTATAGVLGYDRDAEAYTLRRVDDGREIVVAEHLLDRESIARARTVAAQVTKARRRIEAIEAELSQ